MLNRLRNALLAAREELDQMALLSALANARLGGCSFTVFDWIILPYEAAVEAYRECP